MDELNVSDIAGKVMPNKTPPDCDRLTAQFSLHHEHCGAPPLAVNATFSRLLTNQEQPYSRRLKPTGEWQVLETGWVETPGQIVLLNHTPYKGPPKEGEEEVVIEIMLGLPSAGEPDFIVSPMGIFTAELSPTRNRPISWRAKVGTLVTLNVMPR